METGKSFKSGMGNRIYKMYRLWPLHSNSLTFHTCFITAASGGALGLLDVPPVKGRGRNGMNSRDKGARFERELAGMLRDYGYDARRGQQYCGANGDADVIGLPGIHIEAKRVERLNIYDAMSQSKQEAKENEIPTVMFRKNHCKTLVAMEFDDFMEMYGSANIE